MKKAQYGGENETKSGNIMSVLSNLGNSAKPAGNENKAPEKNTNPENIPPNRPVPIPPPPVYVKNAYNDIIEKHDKIVKKILKRNKTK